MEMKKLLVYLFLIASFFFNTAIADENDIDDDTIYLKDDQTFSINTKRKDIKKLNNIDLYAKTVPVSDMEQFFAYIYIMSKSKFLNFEAYVKTT